MRAQAKEIARLRASTFLQSERMAEMQAELDVPPQCAAASRDIDAVALDFHLWAERLVFSIAPQGVVADRPTKVSNLARVLRTVWTGRASEMAVLESELSPVLGMTETIPSDDWFRHPTERERTGAALMPPLRVWHRNHSDGVIAEVAPVAGMGNWRTCASREIGREREAYEGPSFSLLVAAQAAADALGQSRFGHQCDVRCGQWHPAERRRPAVKGRHGSTARVSMAADSPSGLARLRRRNLSR
jgi:hypothetical protein